MPWQPSYEGEIPTLGLQVAEWMETYLVTPDSADYYPLSLTDEQVQFLLNFYEINPTTGKRVIRRAVLSRPRGWGKSPFAASLCAAEALGPVVPNGWDADGRPVGGPWSRVTTPRVRIAAVSEDQAANTFNPLLEMLEYHADDLGLELLGSQVNLPRGEIKTLAASPTTVKGERPVFAVLDQSEEWTVGRRGPKLADVIRTNAAKVGGTTLETPNAYTPGMGSVAEESAEYARKIAENRRAKPRERLNLDHGLLYDHREAPASTDITNRTQLRAALEFVYGDSADTAGGWAPIDRLLAEFSDPGKPVQRLRSDYLNQITYATDAWLSTLDIAAIVDREKSVDRRDAVVLGFDGSRGRARTRPDATALIGCRVRDGHFFEIGVWQPKDDESSKEWQVPEQEVIAAFHDAFKTYNVVGLWADAAMWDGQLALLEAKYGKKMKVGVRREHPFVFNTRSIGQVVQGFEDLEQAILNQDITYDGSYALTKHLGNARRQRTRTGIVLRKPNDDYLAKIDAAYAMMLANLARLAALAAGLGNEQRRATFRRLR